MSLHTTYGMAKPFKEEWNVRPIFEYFVVDRMIELEKIALQNVPTILANSAAIVEDLVAGSGVDIRRKVVLAPHGTLDPLGSDSADRRIDDDHTMHITFVGRFETRKGFDIAAAVLGRACAFARGISITFAGDQLDPVGIEVIKSADAGVLLVDERVRFAGHLSRADLNDLFTKTDVVLMPSRYESFGLVAIEAMAAGATVIALEVGGLKEVIEHASNGFLVPLDGQEVTGCLRYLTILYDDRRLMRTMQSDARRCFESKYTVTTMVTRAEVALVRANGLSPREMIHEPRA